MSSRDFIYWLQGYFELAPPGPLNAEQTDLVKRHLALVFLHEIDPSAGPPGHQAKLNEAHAPSKPHHETTVEPAFTRPQDPGGPVYRC